jgi:hypothetical protein
MSGIEIGLMTAAMGAASSMAQASQQRKAQSQAQAMQAQQAQGQMNELQRQHAKAEQDRQERLRRASATQRAAFAGSGITSDGSGEAVFENLLTQSLQEKQEIDERLDRSIRSLQDGMQLNLLRHQRPDSFSKAASVVQTGIGLGRQLGIF